MRIGGAVRCGAWVRSLACAGLLAGFLSGCVLFPQPEPEPGVSDGLANPGAEPAAGQMLLEPPVLVILSDSRPSHREMCYVLSAALGRPYRILNLEHRTQESVRRTLTGNDGTPVIALGERAMTAASAVPDITVIHAGVLEPEPGHPGVDALPPFVMQLEYWRDRYPELEHIGVIGSARMRNRIASLERAALELGLELEQREVTSDKEAALAFRSLVPKIDGFVFLPDASILSPAVIREFIRHGSLNGVQLLVYSPFMYEMGATLHVETDPVDVAQQILASLDELVVGSDGGGDVLIRAPTRMRARFREQAP